MENGVLGLSDVCAVKMKTIFPLRQFLYPNPMVINRKSHQFIIVTKVSYFHGNCHHHNRHHHNIILITLTNFVCHLEKQV